jgi:DNA invertase Pin-like site-specific DNA recombinase
MSISIRAVLYIRSSDSRQEASDGEQLAWAELNAPKQNIVIERVFSDTGIPGDEISRRKGLQALFAFCERENAAARPITCLLIWDMDRLSRADSVKTAVIVDRLREAGVVKAYSPEGWLDLQDELTMTMHHIKQDFSRRGYAKSMSKNVSRSCLERAQRGEWCGGRVPYGYLVGPDKHLALGEPIRAEAASWVFRTYLERDTSCTELANDLNRRGVPSPLYGERKVRSSGPRETCKGKCWSGSNVRNLLTNLRYTGTAVYGEIHTGKYHQVKIGEIAPCAAVRTAGGSLRQQPVDPEEQIRVPNAHPALVDQETFDLVQAKLLANRPGFKPGSTRRTFKWMLGGLLRCASCGGLMWGKVSMGRHKEKTYEYKRYTCMAPVTCAGRCRCGFSVREADLLPMITAAISGEFSNPEVISNVREQMALEQRAASMDTDGAREHLARRAAELKSVIRDGGSRLARVPEDLIPELVAELRTAKRELAEAEAEIGAIAARQLEKQNGAAMMASKIEMLQNFQGLITGVNQPLARELLRGIVDHIDLYFTRTGKGERQPFNGGVIHTT